MITPKDTATERVALALARGLSSRDYDQGIRLEVEDEGDERRFYAYVDHLIGSNVTPVKYELLLDQRTGPMTLTVKWAPSAVERALENLIAMRDAQPDASARWQVYAIAIDAIRTITGKEE